MQRPVDENVAQLFSPPQQMVHRRISRRTALLGLLGLGGLAALGVANSTGPLSGWMQKWGYPPGLLFSSDEFGSVFEAAWSPDGKRIAFGGLSSDGQHSNPGMIQIWDVFAGEHLLTLAIPTAPDGLFNLLLTWSPDGKTLFSASEGVDLAVADGNIKEVRTWDVATGKSLHSFTFTENGGDVWALNARYIAREVGRFSTGNVVQVRDITNGHLVNTLKGPFSDEAPEAPLLLKWAPDGRRLAVVNGEGVGTVQIWDAIAGTHLQSAQLSESIRGLAPVPPDDHYLAWSPDGKYLAGIRDQGPIDILDPVTNDVVFTYAKNERKSLVDQMAADEGESVEAVAWSSGKKEYIAYSSVDSNSQSTISIYVALTNKRVQTYTQPGHVSRLIWSPDGNYLAVAGGDRLRVWKVVP
jgi:WD40 repeat protein